jgi:HlyD family secretion protein
MSVAKIHSSLHRYQLAGLAAILLILGSTLAWGALTTIHGAVIASGSTVVESYSKKVQHRDGGIVAEIAVNEGDLVNAGQLLLRLDDADSRAELAILEAGLLELIARKARLEAERDNAAGMTFPETLIRRGSEPEIIALIAAQERQLASRRSSISGRKDQLAARITQFEEEIHGLEAQGVSKQAQANLIERELVGLRLLSSKGLVQVGKLLALEREAAGLAGERGRLQAETARAKGQISETQLQIIQIGDDNENRSLAELREVETRIAELQERRLAVSSRLSRTSIRAPRAGIVHQLAVHTVGGVIAPGETVMLIVPQSDRMLVEAQVRPQDIKQVSLGQDAVVLFPGLHQRTSPQVHGRVVHMSADLQNMDALTPPFYVIRLELLAGELDKLGIEALRPGMPAEVFLRTGARTPLEFLLQPLSDQINRAFREG